MPETMDEIIHTSVMVREILTLLKPADSKGIFVDATLGEGGHSEAILGAFPGITVLGVERDSDILGVAQKRLQKYQQRTRFFNMWFTDFFSRYETLLIARPDRILFDLGISNYHFKKSRRGFSFQEEEPLDMRLDADATLTAGEIVNAFSEKELAALFREYGEERFSGRIARRIVEQRRQKKIGSARELAGLILKAVPGGSRDKSGIHPATRCFQALRIVVNREMENLEQVLQLAFDILKPGGRMGVIAYHSLEDRRAKHFFQEKNRVCTCAPEMPVCQCRGERELKILTRKPLVPATAEVLQNRAARSAKLRVIEKLGGK